MKNPLTQIDDAAKSAFRVIPFINVLAPAMLIVCAVGVTIAILQVQKALKSGGQIAAISLQKTTKPKLDTVKLDPNGYVEASTVLGRLNPSVTVAYNKEIDGIRVSVTDPAKLPEWIYLLSTVQGYRKGLMWTASEICLKKCDGGNAAVADLKAFTQKISVESQQN